MVIYMDIQQWSVTETNSQWHESFFSRQALDDHQAKGICPLYWHIIDHLEFAGILEKGDTIFDPMCGIGTTMIISNLKGYASIGNELEYKYYRDMVGYDGEHELDLLNTTKTVRFHIDGNIESFLKKTGRYRYQIHLINKDAKELTKDDLEEYGGKLIVVTSPPYNRTAEHDQGQVDSINNEKYDMNVGHLKPAGYENPKNIAMLKDQAYKVAMHKVWANISKLDVTHIVTVTRDHIDKGAVYKLASITDWAVTTSGYEKIGHIQAKIPYLSVFKIINHRNFHKAKGLPLIDYEDVQIFRRK
jgi:hypothetical protein